jgi:hypothetical protein
LVKLVKDEIVRSILPGKKKPEATDPAKTKRKKHCGPETDASTDKTSSSKKDKPFKFKLSGPFAKKPG